MKLSMKVQSVSGQNLKHDAIFAPPPASYEPAATGISQTLLGIRVCFSDDMTDHLIVKKQGEQLHGVAGYWDSRSCFTHERGHSNRGEHVASRLVGVLLASR